MFRLTPRDIAVVAGTAFAIVVFISIAAAVAIATKQSGSKASFIYDRLQGISQEMDHRDKEMESLEREATGGKVP